MKKLLALVLAMLMVFSVTACAIKDNNKENDDDKYKDDTVVVTEETFGVDTFHFETVDSETVVITSFATTQDKAHDIKIPAYLDGKRVVGIAKEAFRYSSSVLSLTFPTEAEYLEKDAEFTMATHKFTIADYAFRDCVAIKTLNLPAYVTEIGVGAFVGCSSLETLTFAENSQLAEIKDSAFMSCIKLQEVELPASVLTVGSAAFYGCVALESVVISEGTTLVLSQAFQNCTALASIQLPASLVSVGKYAFNGSDALYEGGITYAGTSTDVLAYIDSLMLEPAPEEAPQEPEGEAPGEPTPAE